MAIAGLAWFSTAERMAGMDSGPGTDLGALGWFTSVWAVMMAAMMLPSVAPTVAVYAALVRREPSRVLLFAGGYLLVWSAAGVVAYGLFELGKSLFAGALAWHSGGRGLAAGVLVLAALYQLHAVQACLPAEMPESVAIPAGDVAREPARRIRDGPPQRRMVRGMHVGPDGRAVRARRHEPHWMALIAGLVALEKVGPWGRTARLATAGVLAVLAIAILALPHDVPGFVVPGSTGSMHAMNAMGGGGG